VRQRCGQEVDGGGVLVSRGDDGLADYVQNGEGVQMVGAASSISSSSGVE
jgi:hypothetical protein